MKILANVNGDGFVCEIQLFTQGVERVVFVGDADIDADGANGQNGERAAYMIGNRGSEHLANGGLEMKASRVVGVESWWKDIVLSDVDGNPLVLPNGVIPSRTAYRYPDVSLLDPAAYVDSETIPYIVVPPVVIKGTKGAVLGCRCVVTHKVTGKKSEGVVADVGPRNKVGEVSIQMARELGLNPSPRGGGESRPILEYEVYPGEPAMVGVDVFRLQRSNGDYV